MSSTRSSRRALHGWGRTAPSVARLRSVTSTSEVAAAVREASGSRGVVARGLGRSYGDAAQNAGGVVLDMTRLARIHGIDHEQADRSPSVTADAGVSLDTLMRELLPHGLWVPVLPGTRQVTLGGAVAADVHGKNHHRAGSFGNHVRSLTLVSADGETHRLTPEDDLFWATVGGMGLTGVITEVTCELSRVESAYFVVDTDRTSDIDELMALLAAGDEDYPYSVAWFDSITTGRHLGRAVLTRGRGASVADLPPKLRAEPLRFAAPSLGAVPDVFPSGLVNRLSGRAFNELWYRKAPTHRVGEIQDITQFFHPLDVLTNWNRLYGGRGFCQYQFVVPFGAEGVFRRCVELIAASGHVSCLNVLKRFGPGNSGMLSFPTPGWTLAVDIPVGAGLGGLLRRLDELVLSAGGRIYLAKDSRLDALHLPAMYPRLDHFRRIRRDVDPGGVFVSDLSRRLGL